MTPDRRAAETANKRAERLRRKEAGEQRVEVWLSAKGASYLDFYCDQTGSTRAEVIERALRDYLE